jgi:ribose transport system permease protein
MNKALDSKGQIRDFFRRLVNAREFTLFAVIAVVSIVVSFILPDSFLSEINLQSMGKEIASIGIVAIGMTVVLVSGGIDLSVGSSYGLAAIVTGSLHLGLGINIWIAMLFGLAASVLLGLFNGVFISKVGLNPLIVTLASSIMARGVSMFISEGNIINLRNLPVDFQFLGKGEILGIPVLVLIFAVLVIIGIFAFKKLTVMRKVFFIGCNQKAAVYAGIKVVRIKIGVYVISAFMAGLAGIFTIARFKAAIPTSGTGLEMPVIAAAVIGGASLNGGEGTILGTLLGVMLMSLISDLLVLFSVSVYLQQLASGAILFTSVYLDHFNKKRVQKLA